MGGSAFDDDWELASSPSDARTVVLVGRAGNGKSSTGNSILRKKMFKSLICTNGVTGTCEMQRAVLEDGQIINVIDTPGLFDFNGSEQEFIGKELVKCINMAKDGIHAILVVLSTRTRFTKEERDAVESLRKFFGTKVSQYMIVVFTGGDDLEDNDVTLDEFLNLNIAPHLKETLEMCGNRRVLFDNKTKDELKKYEQLKKLLSLVDEVVDANGGKPYSDELFVELKEGASRLRDQTAEVGALEGKSIEEILEMQEQFRNSYEEQLNRITVMVESKLKETTHRLELQLKEEQDARLLAEALAKDAQKKSDDEIRRLRKNLERAQRETEELRKKADDRLSGCAIL